MTMKILTIAKTFLLILITILLSNISIAQFPEHYFRFKLTQSIDLNEITKIVSIDNIENGFVYAYANEEQWNEIKKRIFHIEELPHPSSLFDHEMNNSGPMEWDLSDILRLQKYDVAVCINLSEYMPN
ncbi:MAG: hypothetical protein IPL67_16575 [Ignavibacteria bacterium]|nr:hypothetical protein [Ignavibacteria bacterium]